MNSVYITPEYKYHYSDREEGLSRQYSANNLVGYWLSHKECYDYLHGQKDDRITLMQLRFCVLAAARMWAYYDDLPQNEKELIEKVIQEMNSFVRQKIGLFGNKGWGILLRCGSFLAHFLNNVSFRIAWVLNRSGAYLRTLKHFG